MKKNYITPEINVIQLDTLCGGPVTASVHRLTLDGECVSTFGVLDEGQTKDNDEYKGLWENSDKWGDD